MPRRPAFSLAYTHERAFASGIAKAFDAPSGIPTRMQALLDRLDAASTEQRQPIADRLKAIRALTEAEAAFAQEASRSHF